MLLPEVLKLNSSGKNSFTSVSVSYGRIIILVASKFFFLFFFRAAGFFIIIFFPGNLTELEGESCFLRYPFWQQFEAAKLLLLLEDRML